MLVRIFAILQLCIVFTLIIWALSQSFLGTLYIFKSESMVYRYLMGENGGGDGSPLGQKVARNEERFEKLPQTDKRLLREGLKNVEGRVSLTGFEKSKRAVEILLFRLPLFLRVWMVMALVVSLMLLLKVEVAGKLVWCLPLLACFYALDNRLNGISPTQINEAFFPKEDVIVKEYLKEPLHGSVDEERKQLLKGWRIYLVKEWAHLVPSQDPDVFQAQAEEGEYAFHLARLKALRESRKTQNRKIHGDQLERELYESKESILMLCLYVIWNLCFALCVYKKIKQDRQAHALG